MSITIGIQHPSDQVTIIVESTMFIWQCEIVSTRSEVIGMDSEGRSRCSVCWGLAINANNTPCVDDRCDTMIGPSVCFDHPAYQWRHVVTDGLATADIDVILTCQIIILVTVVL